MNIPQETLCMHHEKDLMRKTVSLRDNECGVCMSSMRSGQGDMVRDLLRGAMRAPMRKLSLEEVDMFTSHLRVVLVVYSYVLYMFMH